MKTIWKKVLQVTDYQVISVPEGAEFLCAREQMEAICVWFLANPDSKNEDRKIRIIGTGHEIKDLPGRYIGTAILHFGQLVLHVFEG